MAGTKSKRCGISRSSIKCLVCAVYGTRTVLSRDVAMGISSRRRGGVQVYAW